MKRYALIAALVCMTVQAQPAHEHWVSTWATAEALIPPPANPNAANAPRGFNNQTVRMMIRASIGGRRVRVSFSNAFGSEPVEIGAAHIALRAKESEIVPGSDHALSFNGKPGFIMRSGMVMLSDPIDFTFPALADLAISVYVPHEASPATVHSTALHNTYVSKEGDATAAASIPDETPRRSYYWLSTVDVLAPADAATIVTYGDSITDGALSQNETNHSWPALLAARLAKNKGTAQIAVANMGIGGNRVLRDGAGASALARFDRDVISVPGVKWVTILEGINDIGRVGTPESVTADELIGAYQQLIERAHTHGIQVIGCTLTPYEGAGYARPAGEEIREAVNKWIRTGGAFDAVVDFEAATRDPQNPKRFRADFDPGDHLHPNNAGYEAMANAFDLSVFSRKAAKKK